MPYFNRDIAVLFRFQKLCFVDGNSSHDKHFCVCAIFYTFHNTYEIRADIYVHYYINLVIKRRIGKGSVS